MPATLNLAVTASLLLLVRSVKQPQKALSHTDNRFMACERGRPFFGPTLKRLA
jgi:hypothetical protein